MINKKINFTFKINDMKSAFFLCWCIIFSLLLLPTVAHTQNQQLTLKIKSENKTIWSENGKLESLINEAYRQKYHIIKSRLLDELNRQFKLYADRSIREVEFYMDGQKQLSTYFYESEKKLYLRYSLFNNAIHFRITTPDILLGIGKSRDDDPGVSILYNVTADIPLEQNGNLESIKFGIPNWRFSLIKFTSSKLEKRTHKIGSDFLKGWIMNYLFTISDFRKAFYELDIISNSMNDYLNSTIKANSELLGELKLDENRQVDVETDGNFLLVFQQIANREW